jgi:uncharacterized membrane protein
MRWRLDNLTFPKPVFFVALIWLTLCFGSSASGGEKKKDLPARGISVSFEYTGVVVSESEDVSIDVKVTNRGRQDENIDLTVTSVPKGWNAWIKTYNFGVTGVHVASDKSRSLTLRAEQEKGVGPGKYTFGIKAQTADSKFTSTSQMVITVKGKKEEKKKKGINIITSYPVLRGPTGGKFGFSLEVENKLDKDGIFNLAAQGPENWDINFKPAYEEKFISSLRLKAGQSQTVAVEVKPYPWEKPGQYPILVKVTSPQAKADTALSVILTGTYKLDAGTANGLLSLDAFKGKPATVSFYIKNSGSAALNSMQFLSFKPENWKVEFSPEKLNTLAPGEMKQIEVSITPTEEALVGDYSVGISAEAGKMSKTLEFRVTVNASTAWGWIGIGIIVLVVIGLVSLFIRLGRR